MPHFTLSIHFHSRSYCNASCIILTWVRWTIISHLPAPQLPNPIGNCKRTVPTHCIITIELWRRIGTDVFSPTREWDRERKEKVPADLRPFFCIRDTKLRNSTCSIVMWSWSHSQCFSHLMWLQREWEIYGVSHWFLSLITSNNVKSVPSNYRSGKQLDSFQSLLGPQGGFGNPEDLKPDHRS